MNRKRIFGIILFIAIGLFMFTFANPNNRVREDGTTPLDNTQEEITETEKETTEELVAPVVAPVAAPVAQNDDTDAAEAERLAEELASYKAAAKEELVSYASELDLNEDLSRETIVVYSNLIDEATTKAGVDEALENGKAALDEIVKSQELANAIADAIAALESHAEKIDADEIAIATIVNDYTEKLEAVNAIENVEPTLNEGIAALDELAAKELADAKTNAKAELARYASTIVATADGKTNIINEYNGKIDEATTKALVSEALTNGKAALVTLANNEFAAAKTNAKAELARYAATKTIEDGVKAAILGQYNDTIDAVEPYNYDGINAAVTNGKAALDAAEAALALKNHKADAIAELNSYASTKVISNTVKTNTINTYTTLINNASDINTVDTALARAKEALDILEADEAFANAKVNAIAELNTYAKTKDTYKEDKESILSQYETIINNVEAYNYDAINEAVTNGKALLDAAEAKKAFDQYKANAIAEVNNYGSTVAYSTENATVVANYKGNAIASINAATTEASVDAAVENVKKLIDEVVEIRLNGDATVTIVEGMTYTDASVTVISTKYTIDDVVVNSNVNNRVVGNYKVNYTITDSNRVLLASAKRNVNVIAREMTGISIKLAGTNVYSRNMNVSYVEGLVNNVNIEVYKDFNDNTHEKLGKSEEVCDSWFIVCLSSHETEGYKVSGSFDGKNVTTGKTITYTYSKNSNMKATFTYVIERRSVTSIVPETQTGSYKVGASADAVKATINYNNNTTSQTTCTINNFNSSVEGSFNTTMTCAEQEFAYSYTVAYTKDQIQAKASNVDLELYNSDSRVEFHNLGILTVKKVEQVNINFWTSKETLKRTITLGQGTDKFYLSGKDYDTLRENNSFFNGDYIKVTYAYNNIEVVEYYSEIFGYTF